MSEKPQATEGGRIYAGESAGDRLARQRQQFMDAGLELFGTIGYRATTVRGLCKQAGLTDRYFYKAFASIEDLLEAVYRGCMDELQRRLLRAFATPAASEGGSGPIVAGLDAFFEVIEEPRLARVCWVEILGVSPRIDQLYNASIDSFAELLIALMRGLYPQWRIDDEEARIVAIAMIGAVSQSAMHWLLTDYRASRPTMVSATSRLFLGLAHSIESAPTTNQ